LPFGFVFNLLLGLAEAGDRVQIELFWLEHPRRICAINTIVTVDMGSDLNRASEYDFQGIYADFHAKIVRYLTRLIGAGEAEDLAQEVFLKASQGLSSFRGEAQVSTWLYRIATNLAVDRLRSPSYRRVVLLSFPKDGSPDPETRLENGNPWTGVKAPEIEKQLVQKYMNECLMGFIEKLPENYRTVLVLSELEGLSNKDIVDILGVSLETVKIRLHRARARLKEELLNYCEYYWADEMPWRTG
jgi:RNA polymerase sigma-70 factor, ECF subfamily